MNMEVFRTDGSGRTYSDERLFRLVKNVSQFTERKFFDNIEVINDHKGTLCVHLKEWLNGYYLNYYYSVFLVFWNYENEHIVNIYYNGEIIKE